MDRNVLLPALMLATSILFVASCDGRNGYGNTGRSGTEGIPSAAVPPPAAADSPTTGPVALDGTPVHDSQAGIAYTRPSGWTERDPTQQVSKRFSSGAAAPGGSSTFEAGPLNRETFIARGRDLRKTATELSALLAGQFYPFETHAENKVNAPIRLGGVDGWGIETEYSPTRTSDPRFAMRLTVLLIGPDKVSYTLGWSSLDALTARGQLAAIEASITRISD
jgi:hypothetical protein